MSSMRNAVQRRNHKERAQPLERQKWGLLEKHKDYSLRAKDYNEKKQKLRILRQKAAERNPDEFHFAMMSHKFQDGSKRAKRSEFGGMTHEVSTLLKTQDSGYIRTMMQSTRRARERLTEELVLHQTQDEARDDLARTSSPRQHIIFVEDRAEQAEYPSSVLSAAQTGIRPVKNSDQAHFNNNDIEPDNDSLDAAKKVVGESSFSHDEQLARHNDLQTRKHRLEAMRVRERALTIAGQELDLQRAKMAGSIGGVNKKGQRFKIRERRR